MKSISIKQPFASLIISGEKRFEVRSWRTNYRGRLLICSSLGKYQGKLVKDLGGKKALVDPSFFLDYGKEVFPVGMAIGVVDLVDCRPMTKDDEVGSYVQYQPNSFVWVLESPAEIERFEVKGRLSLFDIDSELINEVDQTRFRLSDSSLRSRLQQY